MISANLAWLSKLRTCMRHEIVVVEGKRTREIMNSISEIDMKEPMVTKKARKLNYKFAHAEALSILRGDNTTKTLVKHIKDYQERYARPGTDIISWAYGPKVVDQLPYVVDVLKEDRFSRRAVINIWRENPRWKDPPCTLSLQFLIRVGELHCIATMRSSDLWFGWPYDVFCFSTISAYVALMLKKNGIVRQLGNLYLNAGSQHIYEPQWGLVNDILNSEMLTYDEGFNYYDLSIYGSPASLMNDLETFSHT